jgi:hypothetical protein
MVFADGWPGTIYQPVLRHSRRLIFNRLGAVEKATTKQEQMNEVVSLRPA